MLEHSNISRLTIKKNTSLFIVGFISLFYYVLAFSSTVETSQFSYFANRLCDQSEYKCITIQSNQTWKNLFPNKEIRDLIQRINRFNTPLVAGRKLALPIHIQRASLNDFSPFPLQDSNIHEKTILVNLSALAFAAYNTKGRLVWWGPISPGISDCTVSGGCMTPMGSYRVLGKQGPECVSKTFPLRSSGKKGGAPMPYCVYFAPGYALHGSQEVPGYPASHGCIRLFNEDAKWLNEKFIDIPGGSFPGTRIYIQS